MNSSSCEDIMLDITLEAEEPLSLGPMAAVGNVIDSLGAMPGSVLRGALAAAWIREHGTPITSRSAQNEFRQLFDGAIRYGPLNVEGSGLEPLDVLVCKYEETEGCRSFAVDLCHEPAVEQCTMCSGPVQPGRGRVVGVDLGEDTRTQLDELERSRPGQLFTRRSIPAGALLRGQVSGDHPWLRTPPNPVWVGGRRSVGGRARIQVSNSHGPGPVPRADGRVHIRLKAPGVFVDDAGRPTLGFPVREIETILGAKLHIEKEWIRPTRVGGWHAASYLPKPGEIAVAAGAAVIGKPVRSLTPSALVSLAEIGLGLRRNEGFGWVEVNPQPWRPPPIRPPVEITVSPAVEVVASIPTNLRHRVAQVLQETALALEQGETLASPALSRDLSRDLTPGARGALRRFIQSGTLDTMNDAIALMEAPEWL